MVWRFFQNKKGGGITSELLIYDNICDMAKKAQLSINTIEKAAALGSGSICKWNTVSPSVRSLKKVADILHCSIEQLLIEREE